MALHDTGLHEIVRNELDEARWTGRDESAFRDRFNHTDPADEAALGSLLQEIEEMTAQAPDGYEEPDDLPGILATLPPAPAAQSVTALDEAILAAWTGRVAGNMLGKPIENGDHFTPQRIREYATSCDAYPLRDYIPVDADAADELGFLGN